jgi:tagatose-6-phosphate ketose/aldose isomerase
MVNGSGAGTLSPGLADLAALGEDEQHERGYRYTLAEICQQPETWRVTAAAVRERAPQLAAFLRDAGIEPGRGLIVLTGSGSSHYIGESLALPLQQAFAVPVQAVASGSILTNPDQIVPPGLPCVIVSFARSGDSPESSAALDLLLERRPECRHLIITCNGRGRLAASYPEDSRLLHLVLDDRTCDRSLVMTSSFTNMTLAGSLLASLDAPDAFWSGCEQLADMAASLLAADADRLAGVAARPFRSAVFLASGARLGAAREASLKLAEMTEGRVSTLVESYLGLRHGPMSTVHDDTLVVCFLSCDATRRAYEIDLLRELERKALGGPRLLAGEHVPHSIARPDDTIVEYPDAGALGDDRLVLIDVLVGQLLAFLRCLDMGLKPDDPSSDGVINRVVEEFSIHKR